MRIFWNRSPKKDRERIDGFFKKLDTPIDMVAELSEPVATDALSMLQVVGVLTFCVGLMVVIPAFFLTKSYNIFMTIITGGVLLFIGIIMFFRGWRKAVAIS
jgi:protein-S-isoprenylcysteine O-methyltransferase Ste14